MIKSNEKKSFGNWLMFDSFIFFILILFVSISIIIFSEMLPDEVAYYKNYNETDEYVEDSMQAFLESTVPRTEYESLTGERTEFSNLKVEQLIIEDLNIRQNDAASVNYNSLEQELERELAFALNSIFSNNDFIFICSYSSDSENDLLSNSNLVITNENSLSQLPENRELVYKKTYEPIDNKIDGSQDYEIIIRVYFV